MPSPNWIQCDFIQVNPIWVDSTCGGRSKDYSIDGIPIPFTDEAYDAAAARRQEIRRQQLHEDQLAIDIVVQAVTSGILK